MTGNTPKREPTDKIPATPEEFYEALITEAPLKPGDHGISPAKLVITDCEWFQPSLIQEGKDFVRRNFYSVMLAHCISLLWVFTFKTGRAVLMRTGNTHVENSRDRYLSTVLHIKLWYESDFIEKAAKGSQDIYGVRKKHSAAARTFKEEPESTGLEIPEISEKLKKLMETIQEEMQHIEVCKGSEQLHGDMSQVPLSQYNMTITQFCFVGFLVLMPKSFGILDDTGIQGFVHNWAVFGRLLGIEDRHNLAIHFLTMNQECKRKVFVTIFEKIFLPNLKNLDVTTMYVWDGLVKGFRPYITGMRLKAMVYYLMVYGADVKEPLKLWGLMSWKDKLSFEYTKFCTHSLSKSQLGRGLRNNGVRLGIFKAERRYLPKWKKEDSNHK